MKQISKASELRSLVASWRAAGDCIGLVPTMGNLHAGHLSLVTEAARQADRVVVSIYVNPTQFSPAEDFGCYPETLEADVAALRQHHCDCVFVPEFESVYPGGIEDTTTVNVPVTQQGLCAASRPGHFQGVATVVTRLFNMVQPDLAVFGQKDFQQLLLVRKLARDLLLSVNIIDVPTVRETDGLALSSRNQYLDTGQRRAAPQLYRALQNVLQQIRSTPGDHAKICAQAMTDLAAAGFVPEYLELRNAADLLPPGALHGPLVLLVAARLGTARLIDNLQFSLN